MPTQTSIDLRSTLPPVVDQGRRPTCVAFAVTAAHESRHNGTLCLSKEHLYWQGRNEDLKNGVRSLGGMTFGAALKVLRRSGQVEEQVWPYQMVEPVPYHPPGSVKTATHHSLGYAAKLKDPSAISVIQDQLEKGYCVIGGFELYTNLLRPGNGGKAIVRCPSTYDQLVGRHAMLIVGYNGLEHDPDGYFIVRNSYGPNWGDAGYCYVAYDYCKKHLLESYVVDI